MARVLCDVTESPRGHVQVLTAGTCDGALCGSGAAADGTSCEEATPEQGGPLSRRDWRAHKERESGGKGPRSREPQAGFSTGTLGGRAALLTP